MTSRPGSGKEAALEKRVGGALQGQSLSSGWCHPEARVAGGDFALWALRASQLAANVCCLIPSRVPWAPVSTGRVTRLVTASLVTTNESRGEAGASGLPEGSRDASSSGLWVRKAQGCGPVKISPGLPPFLSCQWYWCEGRHKGHCGGGRPSSGPSGLWASGAQAWM